jgi:methyl-accepting chemotaxis protein
MNRKITMVKRKVTLILFISLFVSLSISELTNSFFNIKFDLNEVSVMERIVISFKPTVMGLYLIFATILMLLIQHYLKPLFQYLSAPPRDKKKREMAYGKARKSAVNLPRMILTFQTAVWFAGTTAYYAMKGWQADSGIPFLFGLLLKISSGTLGGLYVIFFINLILIPYKMDLKITNTRKGEYDSFARTKDFIAIIFSSFYLITQMSYLGWYYSQTTSIPSLNSYFVSTIILYILLFFMSIGPNILSRVEFRLQVREILKAMSRIKSQEDNGHVEPIYLTNFDELGDLAALTNQVVNRFSNIITRVNDAIIKLSESSSNLLETSKANSGATNDQAAAVAEVVATMEDSNRLSKHMGDLSEEVKTHSQENLDKVSHGIETVTQYTNTMQQLKTSNTRAINFVFSLNENIKTIIDVSAIIKSIADQVKIIAFNAELEAAAAGEAGKNFEIVASEVRRLADNTVNAATEIRDKINFIEKESNQLYQASQETTQLIDTGWKLSRETDSSFQIIQETSTVTSQSAHSISDNIQRQISGFEQILLAMKEISHSSQDVSRRIDMTTRTANDLESLIQSLEELAGTEVQSQEPAGS